MVIYWWKSQSAHGGTWQFEPDCQPDGAVQCEPPFGPQWPPRANHDRQAFKESPPNRKGRCWGLALLPVAHRTRRALGRFGRLSCAQRWPPRDQTWPPAFARSLWRMDRTAVASHETGPRPCRDVASVDVGYTPQSDRLLRCREMTLRAMYGRRPRCKRNLTFCEAFGCSHVYGLFSPEGLPPSRCGRCGRWP